MSRNKQWLKDKISERIDKHEINSLSQLLAPDQITLDKKQLFDLIDLMDDEENDKTVQLFIKDCDETIYKREIKKENIEYLIGFLVNDGI